MSERDRTIAAVFERLDVPEHRPGFWEDLHAALARVDVPSAPPTLRLAPLPAEPDDGAPTEPVEVFLQPRPEEDPRSSHRARRTLPRPTRRLMLAAGALAGAAAALIAAVVIVPDRGDDSGRVVVGTGPLATGGPDVTEPAPPPIATAPPPSGIDEPAPPSATVPSTVAPLPRAELDAARSTVDRFIEALGEGAIDEAASFVGPVSEAQLGGPAGVRDLLRQAAGEGHGAWARSDDRTTTVVPLDLGLVVVVYEGTVELEGTREHRVETFPVRKAESADAWFVERWAFDLDAPPIELREPFVDEEERSFFAVGQSTPIVVQATQAGRVWVAFDARTLEPLELGQGEEGRWSTPEGAGLVLVAHASDDGRLFTRAFRILRGAD